MKKHMWRVTFFVTLMTILVLGTGICFEVHAKTADDKILDGIYISRLNVSGMTREEAEQKVQLMVDDMKKAVITLKVNDEHSVEITAEDINLTWNNTDVVEEAARLGKEGNIVKRYKAIKDLQYGTMVFDLDIAIDKNALTQIIQEQCSVYDIPAEDMTLTRENGSFQISGGQTGIEVNVEESVAAVENYLKDEWNYEDAQVALVVQETKPRGSEEELALVKDVLGTFTTSYSTSGSARSANVANGCSLINGTVLYPGDEFSAYDAIKPFTEENGYKLAGFYLNGMVVESLGGGICQVSTTLYNAVLLSELEVTERSNHSMIVTYVDPSADAAIAGTAKDFKFVNNLDHPIYIEGVTADKKITFTIYGVETRPANREVVYESKIISKTVPEGENVVADGGQPIGFIDVQSSHTGYVAELWKIVKEDGVEVSREQVNKSTYKPSPRTATVGTASADPNASAAVNAAIATQNIGHVKNVIAAVKDPAQAAALAAQAAQQAAQQPPAQPAP